MKTPKILVVDDQKANIDLLKVLLREYYIVEATDGRSALRIIMNEMPDLVLLDVMMPGMDGLSVLTIIKNTPDTQLIPVIIVTALDSTDDRLRIIEKGADDMITRPYNPLLLKARVKALLRLKALQDELENVQNMVISLAHALEAKDDYSINHSKRTAHFAEMLAQKILPDKTRQEEIRLAALLHDIGRIGIRDSILDKPDELSSDEFDIIKTHPLIGERICSAISVFQPLLPMIRHHHENYDGSGYPDGLKDMDIPLGARIIAIADGYDALTNDRPYRPAYSSQQALAILRERAGRQWDPELVSIFTAMIIGKDS